MVSTSQIKPAPQLQPFISCYSLRVFNTGSLVMPKPMHAVQESYMTFFIRGNNCEIGGDPGTPRQFMGHSLCNLFTESQGCTYWQGDYAALSIQFKSNGIFAIFGIPQKNLLNTILTAEDVLQNDTNLLVERLQYAGPLEAMGEILNKYFSGWLSKQKHKLYTGIISEISGIIQRNRGLIKMDNLAGHANMSLRNFERRFIEETGMPPKLYARVTRFFNAIEDKMLNPVQTWADIVDKYHYYDQAHFIKEVKEFSSKTPDELFKVTPPAPEKFMQKIEY